jgi:hypothetical protein
MSHLGVIAGARRKTRVPSPPWITYHSRGGRYVFLTKHDAFKLDNQEIAEKYAGQKVRLTGTLDSKANIIQVKTIEPVPVK